MLHKFRPQPVNRILLVSFVIVAIVPLIILSVWSYQAAWKNAWREINEKHRLLALNLASPITIYVDDHRNMLGLLASRLHRMPSGPQDRSRIQARLADAFQHLKGFRALSLVDSKGHLRAVFHATTRQVTDPWIYVGESCFTRTLKTGQWSLSGVKTSPIDGRPTVIMSEPVKAMDGHIVGVLLGELRVDLIEKLRERIHFGRNGHSAIVDQYGHVIAHPNPAWMAEMHDMSKLSIVKAMMAGKTGVTEFFSPFTKKEMVAGYAAVPGIGWGVMVPQPKEEVAAQVDALVTSHLLWSLVGLTLAVVLAFLLSRWITRPINTLVETSEALVRRDFRGDLQALGERVPREMQRLARVLQRLISGLQAERDKVGELNASLQSRVEEATAKLREANLQLKQMARSDFLTGLINRRHFETSLDRWIKDHQDDGIMACIMLIDIDNFKQVNDRYGHAAGDAVLIKVAQLLAGNMRREDLVARYGGDEFVIQLDCAPEVARQRAQYVNSILQAATVEWKSDTIAITASIGLYCRPLDESIDVESLLHQADMAMYDAKQQGRNTVIESRTPRVHGE